VEELIRTEQSGKTERGPSICLIRYYHPQEVVKKRFRKNKVREEADKIDKKKNVLRG
jgi:hypothetical protein